MPSFDIVSEVDLHEVDNSIDQANREIGNRFDFSSLRDSSSSLPRQFINFCD